MADKPIKDRAFTIRLTSELLDDYKKLCDEYSINMTKRIRKIIEMDVEAWKNKKNQQK
jgi:predicted DNA binding CopG/RHH family protein